MTHTESGSDQILIFLHILRVTQLLMATEMDKKGTEYRVVGGRRLQVTGWQVNSQKHAYPYC